MGTRENFDEATVASFGDEWSHFNQSDLDRVEIDSIYQGYFGIFPWDKLPEKAEGFDMGSGSGRWAKCVAPKVGTLNCIDPSIRAIEVAKNNLSRMDNVRFHNAGCVDMLKPGAPFLLYLYYRFDNRPFWFRMIWHLSEIPRAVISRMPDKIKPVFTNLLALLVYWPLARFSKLVEKIGMNVKSIPLSFYRNSSFYTMRTDSRDRFGTPLEQRFTRKEIRAMMEAAGLKDISFSDDEPYWVSLGYKA